MRRLTSAYRPKTPAESVLYQVVRDHFETFRAEAGRVHERDGLPRFIDEHGDRTALAPVAFAR